MLLLIVNRNLQHLFVELANGKITSTVNSTGHFKDALSNVDFSKSGNLLFSFKTLACA